MFQRDINYSLLVANYIYIYINGGVLSHGGTPSSLDGSFHGNPTEKMDGLGTHVQASPGMRTCPMEEGGIHLQGSLGHGCRRDMAWFTEMTVVNLWVWYGNMM